MDVAIQKKALKVVRQKYNLAEPRVLDGNLFLWAFQYSIYDYIYKVPTDKLTFRERDLNRFAHWIHLKSAFIEFTKKWDELVAELKELVYHDILNAAGGDEDHPLLFVFRCVCEMQEMHIRKPKQTPANKTTRGDVGDTIARCYSVVDGRECVFGHNIHGKKNYTQLNFTPLPSDLNFELQDPREFEPIIDDEEVSDPAKRAAIRQKNQAEIEKSVAFEYAHYDGTLPKEYYLEEQFCCVVTPEWGHLARFFHNIFHLLEYINVEVHHIVDEPERFCRREWDDVWAELATPKFCQATVSQFKKGKGAPRVVDSVANLHNIVSGAVKLLEKLQAK